MTDARPFLAVEPESLRAHNAALGPDWLGVYPVGCWRPLIPKGKGNGISGRRAVIRSVVTRGATS